MAASKAAAAAVVSKCVRIAAPRDWPSLRASPIRGRRQMLSGRATTIVSPMWLSGSTFRKFSYEA
jgi:hypothetical protein